MNDFRLLGARVPSTEHFESAVARVLFDASGETSDALPESLQRRVLVLLKRLTRISPAGVMAIVPLLGRIDRELVPRCSGAVRREILSTVCDRAPFALASMPQSSTQAHTLSRALFLSGVLHPDALHRIEKAVEAEGVRISGGSGNE